MNFQETLKRVESSPTFKNFISEYPDAELCAGFFIIDLLDYNDKKNLDYMVDGKVFTFSVDEFDNIIMQEDKFLDITDRPKLSKITPKTNIELDELKGIAGTGALDYGIPNKFQKIIAILQNYSGKETDNEKIQIWNLTCIMEGLIILHILIDSDSGNIIKLEKKNIMDLAS